MGQVCNFDQSKGTRRRARRWENILIIWKRPKRGE